MFWRKIMAKKLEEIKEEECPYELPEGWKWERLENISEIISKGTTPKGGKSVYLENGVNFLRVENINDYGRIEKKDIKYIKNDVHLNELKRSILCEGDVLITIAGTLGKVAIVSKEDLPINTNQAVAFVRLINDIVDGKFLLYYIKCNETQKRLLSRSKITAIPNLTLEIIRNLNVVLPPKETQQKIVDIIESLFAKLDIAQEKVEQVLAESENRRSAILHNAFSGKLTEKWREENNVSFDSWKECKFGDICKFIGGGTPRKDNDEYWSGNINWASIKDIKGKYLNSTTDFITEKGLNNSSANLCSIGELIIGTRINPGKPIISNIETAINQDLKIVKSKLNTEFLYYLFTVNNKKIESLSSGSTVLGIGLKILNNIEIDIPKEEEQKEIVRLLDKFLSVEDKVKSTCQSTLEAIATMRKSILAKAFRGELVS